MDWKTYKSHQKSGWVNFVDQVKICLHRGRQYYDKSDKKVKCSICKKEVI